MSDKLKTTNVLDRIKALKSARAKAVLENRKAVYNEASGLKNQQITKRKLEEEAEREDELGAEKEDDANRKSKDRKPLDISSLSYTAEENDKWQVKQGRIEKHNQDSKKGELQNYKELAEKTYTKNIRNIELSGMKKSVDEYEKEKELYEKLKASGLSSEKIRSKLTLEERLDKYNDNSKKWENQVYQKRQKIDDDGKDGAIHEKNRQFNSKLKRHYDGLKK